MSKKTLSEHDQKLLNRIKEIDQRSGYYEWPTIASLAEKLEDEEERKYWHRQCSHYNHLEEASIGEL